MDDPGGPVSVPAGPTADPRLLPALLDHAADGLVLLDDDRKALWTSRSFLGLIGRAGDNVAGQPLDALLMRDPDFADVATVEALLEAQQVLSARPVHYRPAPLRGPATPSRDVRLQVTELPFEPSGKLPALVLLICRDVTGEMAQKRAIEEIQRKWTEAAQIDMLTGLLNREGLFRKIDELRSARHPKGPLVGLLHIDLDRFKAINDTHGHSAGDAVLYTIADRMRREMGPGDLFARTGGDEFIFVRPGLADSAALRPLAGRLLDCAAEPVDWDDRQLSCGASIGTALTDPGTLEAEALIADADFALYTAKAEGRGGYRHFDDGLRRLKEDQEQLACDIRDAVRENAFQPYFQPIVNFATGQVQTFEALVRWHHPLRGTLAPAAFLKLVADLSLSFDLDRIVLRQALAAQRRFASLGAAGSRGPRISINASPESLLHPGYVDEVIWEVDRLGLDPDLVVIEVLESTLLTNANDPASRAIRRLGDAGVHVALDDYGVGYAGLANLCLAGIDCVKLDRSFVQTALDGGAPTLIMSAVTRLCRELGFSMVAEGVETEEQARRLFALGCTSMQGYWIARPMEGEAAIAWHSAYQVPDLSRPGAAAALRSG